MFGPLGATEIVFILVLALLIFGPRKLPEVGRTVGKALGELRRASTDLKRSVNAELALEEERPLPRRPALSPVGETAAAGTLATVRPAAGARPREAAGSPPEPGISDQELLAANPELAGGGAAGASTADAADPGDVELPAEAPAAHPAPPSPPPAAEPPEPPSAADDSDRAG